MLSTCSRNLLLLTKKKFLPNIIIHRHHRQIFTLPPSLTEFRIPPHNSHKVCTPDDAVSLISANDTICISGFVGQGSPDLILKAISQRYEREQRQLLQQEECCDDQNDGYLKDLTVLFGGGP